jgi:2,3-diketo-5-methylthio-1-phosphopentane phosphatase
MQTFANCVVFSDFDGTITMHDLLDTIVDHYLGKSYRSDIDKQVIENRLEHDRSLKIIFKQIKCSLSDALKLINKYEWVIDPDFKKFYKMIVNKNINIYILSAGFKTFITHFLPYIPEETIYANDIDIINNIWTPRFISKNGLNKVRFIEKLKEIGKKTVYIGDGTSDIGVVEYVDVLFAKKGSYLETYCVQNDIKYIPFINFSDIIDLM